MFGVGQWLTLFGERSVVGGLELDDEDAEAVGDAAAHDGDEQYASTNQPTFLVQLDGIPNIVNIDGHSLEDRHVGNCWWLGSCGLLMAVVRWGCAVDRPWGPYNVDGLAAIGGVVSRQARVSTKSLVRNKHIGKI